MKYSETLTKHIIKFLELNGIKKVKSERKPLHVRAALEQKQFEDSVSKIFKIKEINSDISLSDTYETKSYILESNYNDYKKGEMFYFVSTRKKNSGGTIPTKMLTPNSLGLAKPNNKYNKHQLFQTTLNSIDKVDIPEYIKNFLIDFLKSSEKNNSVLSNVKNINQSDIKTIAKDFGEIVTAYHILSIEKDVSHISFPTASNQALVDFYIHYNNGGYIPISVKSFGGAAPSLKSIAGAAKEGKYDQKFSSVKKFIIDVNDNDGKNGIIEAAKEANHKSYHIVKSEFFNNKDFTNKDIELFFKDIFEKYTDDYILDMLTKKFYDKIGRGVKKETIHRIRNQPNKSGLILSPMAYSVVDYVNTKLEYLEFLNILLNQFDIKQYYVTIINGLVKFEESSFKKSNFVFEYHASAMVPDRNKIGFELKK